MGLRTAIIGCGLIGRKRAQALGEAQLTFCVDVSMERAAALAATTPGAIAGTDWRSVVTGSDVDIVIVATTNDALAPIAAEAARRRKHVLIEKPAGRSAREVDIVIAAAKESGALVRVGFNHRYHPALRKAREIISSGNPGELMFLRGRYGHGGRLGYENEWRANPARSGGGELIDQGVHLIDLTRWFLGEFATIQGTARTFFWNMPVDDNAFLHLETADRKTAFLHCSATEWKNLFSLEIYGRNGKLHAEGLGGSYGVERLSYYKMLPEMGPPETTIWEYPMSDTSWRVEFEEFLEDIRLGRQPSAGLNDARAALSVVERVYLESGYDHRP